MSLLERSDCEEHLKKSSGSSSIFGVRLQESSICSSGGDNGSCEGDDGGALVCASSDDPATFVQARPRWQRAGYSCDVSTISPRLVLSLGERGRPHVVTNNVYKMVKSLLHKQLVMVKLVNLVKSLPSQMVSLPMEVQA